MNSKLRIPLCWKDILIATCTQSGPGKGFPLTNAFQSTFGGGKQDGAVIRLNPSLTTLTFSSYLGGSGEDAANAICMDNTGNIFVAGGTLSANLPGNPPAGLRYNGGPDGFISKISGGGLVRTIYTGTTSYDQVFFVQTDTKGDVYVLGQTTGIMGATAGVYSNANGKQFIRVYSNDLLTPKLSTTLGLGGPYPDISPSAFTVDLCGRIYIAGWGGATNNNAFNWQTGTTYGLPVTQDAFQKTTDGSDFYLMVLSPGLRYLNYATFYGGGTSQEHVDGGTSHFDKDFIVYQAVCAGCGGYSDFPTSPTAYSRVNLGRRAWPGNPPYGCNLALFKFDLNTAPSPPVFRDTVLHVIAGADINFGIRMTDADKDTISFTASGNIMVPGPNPAYIINTQKGPGLTTAELHWQTLCENASKDTFIITLNLSDNSCPTPKTSIGKIKILVSQAFVAAPYPECIKTLGDDSLQFNWPPQGNDTNFKTTYIYRSIGGSPFNLIDSLNDRSIHNYKDTNAVAHLQVNYSYMLLSTNKCNIVSDTSRVISSLSPFPDPSDQPFLNANDTVIVVTASDTMDYSLVITSAHAPMDSVFFKLSGSLLSKNNLTYSTKNGVGKASLNFSWITSCSDITKNGDTTQLHVFVRGNNCPQPNTATKLVKIVVLTVPVLPPPQLNCARRVNNSTIELSWPSFTPNKYFKSVSLIKKFENGSRVVMQTYNDSNAHTFTDDNATDNLKVNYCYALFTTNLCGSNSDTSLYACTLRSQGDYPNNVKWYHVTVFRDKEVHLRWYQPEKQDFWKYEVYKFKLGEKADQGVLLFTSENISDTFLTDQDVLVDEASYCYQVWKINTCGLPSLLNDDACSILLKGISIPFEHNLSWNPYAYWKNGVYQYITERSDVLNPSPVVVGTSSEKFSFYRDNHLDYEAGLYKYKVTAQESLKGNGATSESNEIDLVQAPLLYIPNAYTANGDNLNDFWQTVPVFVKDFNLKLFNRWGEKIFETSDKHAPFTNEFKNNVVGSNVFVYLITYTGWDGSSYTKRGNVTMLR